jgi:hypothetical protein
MKKICIIGCGWYGCHIAQILKDKYDIIMIEKENDIFNNSSYYNQNRLHSGFHYCRDYSTRHLCKNNYERFKSTYNEMIDIIDNNFYLISNESIIDYNTYTNIYKYEEFSFYTIKNKWFNNIYNDILIVNEHVINSDKVYNYFKHELKNINIKFNTKFINYVKKNNKIIIEFMDVNGNSTYECDILLDCTYNQVGLSKKDYIYELTISLLFEKKNKTAFDAITIMDGEFMSLYPRNIELNIYTLTDVLLTPIIKSSKYSDIEKSISGSQLIYNDLNMLSTGMVQTSSETHVSFQIVPNTHIIDNIKDKMITRFIKYYPNFLNDFNYTGYFISKKTKPNSASASRDIIIDEIEENVISVNCGKIYGIFYFEDMIRQKYL